MMEERFQEALDPHVVREIEAELHSELAKVEAQMEALMHEHKRSLVLKKIYEGDPVTRERFNQLNAGIDQYSGRMAALREEERLITGWLARCRALLEDRAA
jgi:hypothetical protein